MNTTGIETLLDQELAAVTDVLEALEAESRALVERDAAALASAVERKTAALGRAAGIEEQRRKAGPEPGPEEGGGVTGRLQRLKDLARRCRDLNDHNGALIRAQRQRVETSLQLLQGGVPAGGLKGSVETYGPDGSARSLPGRRGRLASW
jgi:flagellar biosynthesis/type III secretory pathway chaperone